VEAGGLGLETAAMPKISVTVSHALDSDEVVARLKRESGVLRSSFGEHVHDYRETWVDRALTFGFRTFGMSVEGHVRVEPAEVVATATVPLAAVMFKGAIEEQMRSRLEQLVRSPA
jgi:hypothetical protein